MAITGIHHVSAITDDIDASHRFYTHALGLYRVKQSVNQDELSIPHHFWAHYDGETVTPGSSMTLFGWPADYKQTRGGTGQTHHVAFRAPTPASSRATTRARARSSGVSARFRSPASPAAIVGVTCRTRSAGTSARG
jgi:glyoxalase family protein